eukprot:622159-Amphidinium_carterae.1
MGFGSRANRVAKTQPESFHTVNTVTMRADIHDMKVLLLNAASRRGMWQSLFKCLLNYSLARACSAHDLRTPKPLISPKIPK